MQAAGLLFLGTFDSLSSCLNSPSFILRGIDNRVWTNMITTFLTINVLALELSSTDQLPLYLMTCQ